MCVRACVHVRSSKCDVIFRAMRSNAFQATHSRSHPTLAPQIPSHSPSIYQIPAPWKSSDTCPRPSPLVIYGSPSNVGTARGTAGHSLNQGILLTAVHVYFTEKKRIYLGLYCVWFVLWPLCEMRRGKSFQNPFKIQSIS